MKKISLFTKLTFHFSNVTLLILYLYPGSIIGWLVYGDFQKQPHITSNFAVSSNHVYAFFLFPITNVNSPFKLISPLEILSIISFALPLKTDSFIFVSSLQIATSVFFEFICISSKNFFSLLPGIKKILVRFSKIIFLATFFAELLFFGTKPQKTKLFRFSPES